MLTLWRENSIKILHSTLLGICSPPYLVKLVALQHFSLNNWYLLSELPNPPDVASQYLLLKHIRTITRFLNQKYLGSSFISGRQPKYYWRFLPKYFLTIKGRNTNTTSDATNQENKLFSNNHTNHQGWLQYKSSIEVGAFFCCYMQSNQTVSESQVFGAFLGKTGTTVSCYFMINWELLPTNGFTLGSPERRGWSNSMKHSWFLLLQKNVWTIFVVKTVVRLATR